MGADYRDEFNDLVRAAARAREAFDGFDPPETRAGLLVYDLLVADWDAANAALVRFVRRHGAALLREVGGDEDGEEVAKARKG